MSIPFTKSLRARVRSGRIRSTIRIWLKLHVKVGNRYRMDDGFVVIDSVEPIRIRDITPDLARESGFDSVAALLKVARHGRGTKAFLIRFHWVPAGAWE